MATRDMRYRRRNYSVASEEATFQLDRALRIMRQGRERAIRCDRKYETNAARQKAYRQRLRQRQQPITPDQWRLLANLFVEALGRQDRTRRTLLTHAFNELLRAHRTGLSIELRDP